MPSPGFQPGDQEASAAPTPSPAFQPGDRGERVLGGAAVPHHQAPLPPTWHLADEAKLPGGRTITGTAARVYNLLLETRRRNHRWSVGRHLARAGWVPTWVLREPWAGGAAGDRRLRDLREEGIPIESEKFALDGDTSASWLWRLAPVQGASSVSRLALDGSTTPPTRPTPAHPRERGGALSRSAGEGRGGGGPLQGLTIRLVSGTPPPAATDISPGASSPLAPAFGACDDEAYRRDLLQLYHSGRLVSVLTGRAAWTFWTDPAAAYDPRPVLTAALTRLGATLGH